MVDWQVTAGTIHCDAVDDDVTVVIYADWTVNCSGYRRYAGSSDESVRLVKKSLELRRVVECQGLGCEQISDYKRSLLVEEAAKE